MSTKFICCNVKTHKKLKYKYGAKFCIYLIILNIRQDTIKRSNSLFNHIYNIIQTRKLDYTKYMPKSL